MTLLVAAVDGNGVWMVADTAISGTGVEVRDRPTRLKIISSFDERALICEFTFQQKPLSVDFVANPLQRNGNGEIAAPDTPGLGIKINPAGMRNHLVDVEIKVAGKALYETPRLG